MCRSLLTEHALHAVHRRSGFTCNICDVKLDLEVAQHLISILQLFNGTNLLLQLAKMNPSQLAAIKGQEEFRAIIEQKQKLDSQMNEILMAKEEVDLLESDATIYKLIGPLMVPQDLTEVKETIDGRLKYLNGKVEYLEKELKTKFGSSK